MYVKSSQRISFARKLVYCHYTWRFLVVVHHQAFFVRKYVIGLNKCGKIQFIRLKKCIGLMRIRFKKCNFVIGRIRLHLCLKGK